MRYCPSQLTGAAASFACPPDPTSRGHNIGPRDGLDLPKMSDRLRHIHWLVPAFALGSLVDGILLAVGHHLFYNSLNGTTPSLLVYNFAGSQISGQALNLAIGTTFAFLVRSCLAFAMSLSCVQLAWYTIKRSSRDYTILDIDRVTSALSNLLVVLNVFAWIKWPLMLLAALLSWYSPSDPDLEFPSNRSAGFYRSQQ